MSWFTCCGTSEGKWGARSNASHRSESRFRVHGQQTDSRVDQDAAPRQEVDGQSQAVANWRFPSRADGEAIGFPSHTLEASITNVNSTSD